MTADSSQSPEDQRVTPLIKWVRWNVKDWRSLSLSPFLPSSLSFFNIFSFSCSSSLVFEDSVNNSLTSVCHPSLWLLATFFAGSVHMLSILTYLFFKKKNCILTKGLKPFSLLSQSNWNSITAFWTRHRYKYEFGWGNNVCGCVSALIWFICAPHVLHFVHFHGPELNNNTAGLVQGDFTLYIYK